MRMILLLIVGMLLILYCRRSFAPGRQRLLAYGLTLSGMVFLLLYFCGYVGVGIPGLLLELFGKAGVLQ